MKTPRYTLDSLNKEFPNDLACLEYIFQKRYGHLEFCPRCAAQTKFYKLKTRKIYKCKHCGFELYPLANTIFHKSDTPLTKWFFAIYLFSNGKNGTSAKELERHLGVTYKTAWRMAKQIRLMLQENGGMLSGTVEADETYVGGFHKGQSGKWDNKTAVIGVVEKKKDLGRVKAVATRYVDASVTLPFLRASLEAGSTLHTDDSRIYSRVKRDFSHEFVNHSKLEYVRAGVHTNTIEGFWGQLKRSLDGTYHSVSPKYLQLYVNEFVYRYNHRHVAAFPAMMEVAAKPVR
jgi:transposase